MHTKMKKGDLFILLSAVAEGGTHFLGRLHCVLPLLTLEIVKSSEAKQSEIFSRCQGKLIFAGVISRPVIPNRDELTLHFSGSISCNAFCFLAFSANI